MKAIYLVALAASLLGMHAQTLPVSWEDNFNDDSNEWLWNFNGIQGGEIRNGMLSLEANSPAEYIVVAPCNSPYVDFTADYEIEVRMSGISERRTLVYSLISGGRFTPFEEASNVLINGRTIFIASSYAQPRKLTLTDAGTPLPFENVNVREVQQRPEDSMTDFDPSTIEPSEQDDDPIPIYTSPLSPQPKRRRGVVAAPGKGVVEFSPDDPESIQRAAEILGRPIIIEPDGEGDGGGGPAVRVRPPRKRTSIPSAYGPFGWYTNAIRKREGENEKDRSPQKLFSWQEGIAKSGEVDDYFQKMTSGALDIWKRTQGGDELQRLISGLVEYERNTGLAFLQTGGDNFVGDLGRGAGETLTWLLSLGGYIPGIGAAFGHKKPVSEWQNQLYRYLRNTSGLSDYAAMDYAQTIIQTYQYAKGSHSATWHEIRKFTKDFARQLDVAKDLLKQEETYYAGMHENYYEQFRTKTVGYVAGQILGTVVIMLGMAGLAWIRLGAALLGTCVVAIEYPMFWV